MSETLDEAVLTHAKTHWVPENTILTPENTKDRHQWADDHIEIRVAQCFSFWKGKKCIGLNPEMATSADLSRITLRATVSSLNGPARYLVQAGEPYFPWPLQHFELMQIKRIREIKVDSHECFRDGQPAICIFTDKYQYFLLQPDIFYETTWRANISAWESTWPTSICLEFLDASVDDPRYPWWKGLASWLAWVEATRKERGLEDKPLAHKAGPREDDENDLEEDDEDVPGSRGKSGGKGSGKGKGKATPRAKQGVSGASQRSRKAAEAKTDKDMAATSLRNHQREPNLAGPVRRSKRVGRVAQPAGVRRSRKVPTSDTSSPVPADVEKDSDVPQPAPAATLVGSSQLEDSGTTAAATTDAGLGLPSPSQTPVAQHTPAPAPMHSYLMEVSNVANDSDAARNDRLLELALQSAGVSGPSGSPDHDPELLAVAQMLVTPVRPSLGVAESPFQGGSQLSVPGFEAVFSYSGYNGAITDSSILGLPYAQDRSTLGYGVDYLSVLSELDLYVASIDPNIGAAADWQLYGEPNEAPDSILQPPEMRGL